MDRCILEAVSGDPLARNTLIDWLCDCGHEGLVAEVAELAECGLADDEWDRIRFDPRGFVWARRTMPQAVEWTSVFMPPLPRICKAVAGYLCGRDDDIDLLYIVAALLGWNYPCGSKLGNHVEFY